MSGRRHALDLVQQKDRTLLLGEPIEQATKGAHPLETRDVLVRRETRVGLRLVALGVDELRAAARGALVHEHDVDRDAVQPRRELGLASEVLEAAMNLEKNLLEDVLEIGARANHAEHEARDLGAVAHEELTERRAVPLLAARDHFFRVEHGIKASPPATGCPAKSRLTAAASTVSFRCRRWAAAFNDRCTAHDPHRKYRLGADISASFAAGRPTGP